MLVAILFEMAYFIGNQLEPGSDERTNLIMHIFSGITGFFGLGAVLYQEFLKS